MKPEHAFSAIIPGVAVPTSLIADPAGFGGRPLRDCLVGDLIVKQGRAEGLLPSDAPATMMVLPRLAEPHVHLDKCHSIDGMDGVGGDLQAAIDAQRTDKARWTEAGIRTRAARGLRELLAAGCGAVRSHVDWGDDLSGDRPPPAWEILGDLAAEVPLTLQRAALTGIEQLADPGFARRCAGWLARQDGVLGSFVFDQTSRDDGIANAFREADRFGLALDFHVDEGLQPGLDGLERIADAALAVRFQGPVLCGHACSLANLDVDSVARIGDKLARAGIAVAVLPQTNLYLQGRQAGTPDRRGITRVHELRAAGVRVVMGADNVRDAFCPIGRHDPVATLALGVLAAHLDPPLGRFLPMITTDARRAMGLAPMTVDGAAIGDLVSFDTGATTDLLSGVPAPRPIIDITGALP